MRPEDQGAGSMQTVFPFRESERDDEHALPRRSARRQPAMLIRLRPGTAVIQAPGQENFHYGDFYAYSKICTHLGCPTSLYEAQTSASSARATSRSSSRRSTPSRFSVPRLARCPNFRLP